jgi:hypothetical protein
MQTKVHWIPLEQIYSTCLTKSLFVHYCLVENFKKSNLEVFNYKNQYKIKSPNFECMLISYSIACIK